MSTPSTPTRSHNVSASSTPSNTRDGPSEELTPRSKVKAMLAALDDDSDDQSALPKTSRPKSTSATAKPSDSAPTLGSDISDEESEEEDIVVPVGRMTQRMRGNETESKEQNAYSRVKQQLPQEKQSTPEQEELFSKDMSSPGGEEGSQDPKLPSSDHEDGELPRPRLGKFMLRKKAKTAPSNEREDVSAPTRPTPEVDGQADQSHVHTRSDSELPASHSADDTDDNTRKQASTKHMALEQSDSDPESQAPSTNRFQALVERKRAERRAKEAEEEQKREKRHSEMSKQASKSQNVSSDLSGSEEDDVATGKKLTQQSRPARKASKKALEEMSREQQRIQRNMQLAHEATTKKKISKESFLARFNFKTSASVDATKTVQSVSSTTCSSAPASDVEGKAEYQTPPSSPASNDLGSGKGKEKATQPANESAASNFLVARFEMPSDLHDLQHPISTGSGANTIGKGKGKMIEPAVEQIPAKKEPLFKQRPIKIHPPKNPVAPANLMYDSDDDLEIVPQGKRDKKLDAIFSKIPEKKAADPGQSMLRLRALAHLTSPSKKTTKAGLNNAQLFSTLQRKARQQAIQERLAKVKELEAKGIIIQTAEERERDQAQIEDILEKARLEAVALKEKEKEERRDNGEDVESTDDEDWEEGAQSDGDKSADGEDEIEVDLSGSEDEAVDDQDKHGLFDNEASESENEEQKVVADLEDEAADDESAPVASKSRRSNHQRILDDDEDGEENPGVQSGLSSQPQAPNNNPFAAMDTTPVKNPFGVVGQSPNLPNNPFNAATKDGQDSLGLTQAFAATMSDAIIDGSQEQDSMEQLREMMPQPDLPIHDSLTQSNTQTQPITQPLTQVNDSFQINLNYDQSQVDSMEQEHLPGPTQLSEIPDPTQDVGVGAVSPVKRGPAVPTSTIDTVIMPPVQVQESPIQKRKGRLQRRNEIHGKRIAVFSDDEADSDQSGPDKDADFDISANAFDVLKKAAKKPKAEELFDKKNSKAKNMFEEQAEESEDEYAGLGGADGEDSDEEADESLKEMIDENHVDVDEAKMAALFADKDRAADEAAMQKLMKDLQNGGLRRKRGADFDDLDDSDDDMEARRTRKRAEFARMRRALVEGNANVGKIAEDPKKKAFLRAIEDREVDADFDRGWFEEDEAPGNQSTQEVPESQISNSQAENQDPAIAMPAPLTSLKRKLPANDSSSSNKASRRPFRPTKPTTLAGIRANISSLTEDPHDISTAGRSALDLSDSSADESSQPFSRPSHPRRTTRPVIDRLAAKRADSLNAHNGGQQQRMAFHDPATSTSQPGFKVPSLLRRATTSSLAGMAANNADANGVVQYVERTERAIGGDKDTVKRGGSKKSSVNFFVREQGKERVLRAGEKRKEEGRRRIAGERQGLLGGVLGKGSWE